MKKVVVIGGGITGLTTMYYLEGLLGKESKDVELILIEKDEKLGGKIRTVEHDEFIIEAGADSMVARHDSVVSLVSELELEEEAVYNATGISYIYTNNELHAIPLESVFGIPISKEALHSSTLVSEEGKERVLKEPTLQNDSFTKDSSIGEFLEYFLGKEIVDKQIAPVLSGVYSGRLDELTLATTLPYLLDYKNTYGSIIEGLAANKEKFLSAANKKFMSFEKGLATIIDRLEEKLNNTTIIKGIAAETIDKEGEKYSLQLSDGRTLDADHIVLSIPHNVSQALLQNRDLDEHFNKLTTASLISIYLGYNISDEALPKDGTGYIVLENSDVKCNACTWTSRKWKHTSANGNFLTRLFYKSSNPAYESMKEMSDEELVKVAMNDIEKSLNITGKPQVVEITKWENAMPNYHLEHKNAIVSLEGIMKQSYPNVLLAGCSYYGVGIGACIENGKDIAEQIFNQLK